MTLALPGTDTRAARARAQQGGARGCGQVPGPVPGVAGKEPGGCQGRCQGVQGSTEAGKVSGQVAKMGRRYLSRSWKRYQRCRRRYLRKVEGR